MLIRVQTKPGKLQIYAPFELKDTVKTLPACRFSKKAKAWEIPATVASARNVKAMIDSLKATGTPVQGLGDRSFQSLLSMARVQDEATQVKNHHCNDACPQWHHQSQAYAFAEKQPRCMLAMAMGTGKTKVALDLICGRNHRAVLVLTKKKAIGVWEKQAKQWATKPLHVVRVDTGNTARKVNQAQNAMDYARANNLPVVIVMNYESAWRAPFGPLYETRETTGKDGKSKKTTVLVNKGWALTAGFDLIIEDESHKIKAPGGKASKFCQHLAMVVPCILQLTGTPMGDKPADLYGQFRALDAGVFGTSFKDFQDQYMIMGGFENREILGYKNKDEMMTRAGRFMYFVGDDVLKLMPARHKTYFCTLTPEERRVYDRMENDAFVALREKEAGTESIYNITAVASADNILVKLLRCQQITGGFIVDENEKVQQIGDSKAQLLQEVITDLIETEEIKHGNAVVVYCKFSEDLRKVRALAEKIGYTYGEISGKRDDQELFKAGKVNLLGCQIQAGGTGVDGLQEASHVAIYFSTGYSLTDYEQATKRLDRPGQTKSVLNIHLVAEDTIDETVIAALENKQNIIAFMVEKAKQTITGGL
jgi:SNF2 family DNA or RNA helicase